VSAELKKRLEELDAQYANVVWPGSSAGQRADAAAVRERIVRDGGLTFAAGQRAMLPLSEARFASVLAGVGRHAVFEVGPWALMLERARAAFAEAGTEGTVVVRVRWPWDGQFYAMVRELGLKVIGYHREVDHTLLPSLHVLDGGGDLVLLSGAVPPSVVSLSTPVLPYAWCDIDGLDLARLTDSPLQRMAARVAELVGPAEFVDMQAGDERSILTWYAPSSHGFVAELQPALQHLLISYVPYDDVLDHAAVTAAFELFANADTRSRPRRTERTPERTVFQ
jgi:hypothetical protein